MLKVQNNLWKSQRIIPAIWKGAFFLFLMLTMLLIQEKDAIHSWIMVTRRSPGLWVLDHPRQLRACERNGTALFLYKYFINILYTSGTLRNWLLGPQKYQCRLCICYSWTFFVTSGRCPTSSRSATRCKELIFSAVSSTLLRAKWCKCYKLASLCLRCHYDW